MTSKPADDGSDKKRLKHKPRCGGDVISPEPAASTDWLLNALLDNLNVGVFMVEAPSGRPILANHHAISLLGRDIMDGAAGNNLGEAYKAYRLGTDRYYPENDMPIVRGLQGEYTSADDMVIVRPDGKRVFIEVFGCPVKDDRGNIVASLASFTDITDRKRAEEALHLSLEKFEKTFKAAPVWVVLSAVEDGRYIEVNDAFLHTTGYRREEVIGKTSLHLGTWADPADRARIISVISKKGGIRNKAVQRKTRSGQIIDTLFSAEVLRLEGRPVMISVSQDITEQKRAEEEREKLQAQLLQAQKMESVGRLAGGVAHDFNNMLGVIIGHSEMAMQQMDPASPVHDDLVEIKKAARRSADLTRQLLAFARRQTAAPVVLDLNETINGMLKMLRRLIGEDIDLSWTPGENIWPVKMDPSQIDQIMANLCVNARDAIDGVGKIIIETQNFRADALYCGDHPEFAPGNYVMLAVSDDGHGMSREVHDNLFEPFYTTKKVGKGTGLGLSTVYGIVKQNDGFINVYSEPGAGATFKIYLPRNREITAARGKSTAEAVVGGSETVLLVEDEVAILRMGKTMLERFGYDVLDAHRPEEALSIVESHSGPIHLLITDVVMPDMNGKELAAQIRKKHPRIKVLFMSGYTANVIMHRGILKDDVNFLQKPFTVESLIGKARRVLDQPAG